MVIANEAHGRRNIKDELKELNRIDAKLKETQSRIEAEVKATQSIIVQGAEATMKALKGDPDSWSTF